jgi:DNA-directed RNA polymerase subunit RPC12/RpoP
MSQLLTSRLQRIAESDDGLGAKGIRRRGGTVSCYGGNNGYSEIRKLLIGGLNYAEIGKTLGISRERVRQLAEEHGYAELRWQVPDGYLPLRKYAEAKGLKSSVVQGRIRRGDLDALRIHNRLYIRPGEGKRCLRCGQRFDGTLEESRRLVCDECKGKARKRAQWRFFYRRMKIPLGPTLGYMRKPSS